MTDALASGEYDFAFLHVKAVDDAGHDKAPLLKVCSGMRLPLACTVSAVLSLACVRLACRGGL